MKEEKLFTQEEEDYVVNNAVKELDIIKESIEKYNNEEEMRDDIRKVILKIIDTLNDFINKKDNN